MRTLPIVKTASLPATLFALFLFCLALPPTARAYEWVIGGTSGTTAFPMGANTASGVGADLIKNGDIITLYMDVTNGGPQNNANQPLILFSDISQVAGFTIRSGAPGTWFTVSNTRTPAAGATRVMTGFPGNNTYTFTEINFANNRTSDRNGAVILFQAGNPSPAVTTQTVVQGTMAFTNNGGGIRLTGTAMNGGALCLNASSFKFSGSITFDRNFADIGGAVNAATQNTEVGTVEFHGDTLFVSNSANCGGAYSTIGSAHTTAFYDLVRFENNFSAAQTFANAWGGGAIATAARGRNGNASTGSLLISGTSLFNNNRSMAVGGAISFGGATLYISGNSTFTNNVSGTWGGAIYQYNGNQTMANGGGSQAASGVSFTLDASTGDILFQNNFENKGLSLLDPGERNAITFYSGAYSGGARKTTVTLNTGTGGTGANTIYFDDPIRVTNTHSLGATQNSVNVNVTGSGVVVFDTFQSAMASGTTTLVSGTMMLTNGAMYGTGTNIYYVDQYTGSSVPAFAPLVMDLQARATLSSNNGSVQADTIRYASGARVDVFGGGTLALYANTFTGTGLHLSGNGTIDTGGAPINASLVSVGSIVSGIPGEPPAANTAQTLILGASTPLTIANKGIIAFDLFADTNTSDLLIVNTLALSGSAYININGAVNGSFEVIRHAGDLRLLDDKFVPLVNGVAPTGHYSAAKDYRNEGAELWVNVSTKNIITRWTGAVGDIWRSPVGGDNINNWNDGGGSDADYIFLNGDRVIFDDNAIGKNITIAAAGVIVVDMAVSNTTGDYTFGGAGGITTSTTGILGDLLTDPTGKLIKTGPGGLNFTNTGSNNFIGGIEVSGGTIGFTSGAQLGDGGNGIHITDDSAMRANASATLANNLAVDAGQTLTLDTAANTLTYTGALNLDSTGTLAKTGSGVLAITSENSGAAGKTLVSEGVLAINTPAGKLGGIIDIASGATLAGDGSATGTVNAGPGAIIAPGALRTQSAATLNINNLNIDSATLRFDLFADGSNDRINVAGTATATGANIIDINKFRAGSFNLGGIGVLDGAQVNLDGLVQAGNERQRASLVRDGDNLIVNATADISRIIHWTGASNDQWNPSGTNWTDGNASAPVNLYAGGDRVYFDDSAGAAAPHDIFIAGNHGALVSDLHVQGDSSYTFTGAGITADSDSIFAGSVLAAGDGTGKLYKAGSGTLAFNNAANNFLGGIDIAGGAITFTDGSQLGDGGSGNGIIFSGDGRLATDTNGLGLVANINVAAGVTGTIDAGANALALSGALGGAGTLAKIGSGTLALTGTSLGATDLTLGIQEGTLLLANTAFNGTIDAHENTILASTGTNAQGTLRVETGATVQMLGDMLAASNIELAASSTLTGKGAMQFGNLTLNGMAVANITASDTLALTGSYTGDAGGIHKTGDGELLFTGIATGNAGTAQLDQGTIRYSGIAAHLATQATQDIVLNGGHLVFGTGTAATINELTANDWSGLKLTQGTLAAASSIAGSNDMVHLGSGTFTPAFLQGMHIAVAAGDSTTVLNNLNNTFAGVVRIDSGTLQVHDIRQLGTPGEPNTNKIILNGGALRISATTFELPSNLILRNSGTSAIIVDENISASIGRVMRVRIDTRTATLLKLGSGTLTFTNVTQDNAFDPTALIVAEGRVIATSVNSLPFSGGPVTIHDGAVFQLSPTAEGTISSPFLGDGTLEVTSQSLVFTGAQTNVAKINISGSATQVTVNARYFGPQSTITVDQAKLIFAFPEQDLGNVVLKNGANMGFVNASTEIPGRKAILASLTSEDDTIHPIQFNLDLIHGRVDHLKVNTPVVGNYQINFNQILSYTTIVTASGTRFVVSSTLPKNYHATMEVVNAPQSDNGSFVLGTTELEHGLYKYTVSSTTAGGNFSATITGTGAMSNSAATINSLAAMLPTSWFAELTSVTQRMGALHFENRHNKAGLAGWVRGYAGQLDFNDKLTGTEFGERQYATEVGVDYKSGGTWNFYLGAFAGYGRSTRNCFAAGDATLDSYFGGIYETLVSPSGWYLDGVVKFNDFKSDLTARAPTGESTSANYRNWGAGVSLEFGKHQKLPYDWYVVPSIQAALTAIRGKTYETDSGMTVELTPGTTVLGRAGFMFGRDIETANGAFTLYVKGYYGRQKTADSQLNVTVPGIAAPVNYDPKLNGFNITGGAGIAWLIKQRTQLYFDYETTQTEYYVKPWGLNFGIRHNW